MPHAARVAHAKVAIVVSHPIQHFAPLYRELAKQPELEIKVFFCSRLGLDEYYDPDFGLELKWETDLLAGYQSEFVAGASAVRRIGFWTVHGSDINRRLEQYGPDVVQIYGYSQAVALRTLLWSVQHGVPALLMSDSELVHARPLAIRALKRVALPLIYGRVSGFLTIGDNNEAYLRHYGVEPDRLFRSPYPTDDGLFLGALEERTALRRQVRAKLNISDSAVGVVFVGKLIPRKRPCDVVEAVNIARRRTGLDIVALLVGDGELRETLQSNGGRPAEGVRFAGFVNQRHLPGMYAASDVIAHPAAADAHPLAVTEAVLMGLPAVVSDKIGSVGPTDTVRVGENGLVFPCGDVDALASALERLASDAVLRASMGAASRRIASETGLHASVAGYVTAVKTLLENRLNAGEQAGM
jgi:glycosyltransferase involved in cell wall biosynthesis